MIRPSALQRAEKCPESAYLAAEHQAGNAATENGREVDAQVTAWYQDGTLPTRVEAQALIEWAKQRFFSPAARYYPQLKLPLLDPATAEPLTTGTADLVVLQGDDITVVDWKSIGQLWTGQLDPSDNLQTAVYGAAACQLFNVDRYRTVLACFDDSGRVLPIEAEPRRVDWGLIDRVKAIMARPREAVTGPWCERCYSRLHCKAYVLPAMAETPRALQPLTDPGALTTLEQARELGAWCQRASAAIKAAGEILDRAEGALQAWSAQHPDDKVVVDGKEYTQTTNAGRRTGPTVKELEAAGLEHLVKTGKPYTTWRWKVAK